MHQPESARLAALRELNLLDSAPGESFDRVTRMASQLFNLPISAISLTDVDRQWFKSRVGVEHRQLGRDRAPCAQIAETRQLLVLPDLLADPYYKDCEVAKAGVRFYAGAPLITRDGFGLGAMCVLGMEPRSITAAEEAALVDLAAMVMSQIELEHAFGRIDPVSGLPNRNQLIEDLEDMGRDHRGEECAGILIDLIESERLSDAARAMGLSLADDLMKRSARALRSVLGLEAKIYHVGPTHYFYLAQGPAVSGAAAEAVANKVRGIMHFDATGMAINPVMGIAPFVFGEATPTYILHMADSAAQDARQAERRVSIYSTSLDAAHRRKFTLLTDFAAALTRDDQLSLAYQPKVDLKTGRCVGAEALLRWRHASLGTISPGEFIPLIEQTPLTREMTRWVLNTALRQIALWQDDAFQGRVSINISAANLDEDDFARDVVDMLARHRVAASSLELELTESALIANGQRALEQLRLLEDAGITLSIDDFGTGYSSMTYLHQIPAKVVKIDQSFMKTLTSSDATRTLVPDMTSMAHNMGYEVVAEGVETLAVYRLLREHGCDEAQGYYLARPMPPTDFEAWLCLETEALLLSA